MTGTTSMLHVRVDETVKARASEALAASGLTVSDAVRILLHRIAADGGMPPGLVTTQQGYDDWFRAKVLAALATPAVPTTSDDIALQSQAVIDRARASRTDRGAD